MEKDLRDRIRDDEFVLRIPYPKRPVPPRLPVNHNSSDALTYAENLAEFEVQKSEYQEKVAEYRKKQFDLDDMFKKAAIEYCGLSGHPKAEQAFNKARENSDMEGLMSILNELEELADLLL